MRKPYSWEHRPRKVIAHRTPSCVTRHTTCAPFACVGELHLDVERSHNPYWDALVTYRCTGCGKVVEVFGTLRYQPEQWADDGDGDTDATSYGL